MPLKFNLIAAVGENMGIGKNNQLPWDLRSEMQYFTNMTTTTVDKNKKNVVIMGRRTWDSIPCETKPFKNRINFVLSRSKLDFSEYNSKDVYGFNTWDEIYKKLNDINFMEEYETVWIIGGSNIYKESMESNYFYRLYLTEIKATFDCDTYFPLTGDNLQIIRDPNVSDEVQEENVVNQALGGPQGPQVPLKFTAPSSSKYVL